MNSFQKNFPEDCRRIRAASPLVLNITNYVAMNFSANALLAAGASPLMSSEPSEMKELVSLCNSLVINIGCLDSTQIKAMKIAAECASDMHKPWVLDPAGAGASVLRTETATLLSSLGPSVIRGNASEMLSLCGGKASGRGVDSTEESACAVRAAKHLALKYGCIVSVSGASDYITDGHATVCIHNGNPLMTKVTAMGCVASAMTAAFCAVNGNSLEAAAEAMALMGVTGERACVECKGTGSLQTVFLDMLCSHVPEETAAEIKSEII